MIQKKESNANNKNNEIKKIKIKKVINKKIYKKINKINKKSIYSIKHQLNNKVMNKFFIECNLIYKKFPPSKNENKFLFGGLVQKSCVQMLESVFYKCIDLDELHSYGSEFKNDCCLYLSKYKKLFISIKCKSKKCGEIILINKNSNHKIYDLSDLITLLIVIETNQIIIIEHKRFGDSFLKDNNSNIVYKSSLLTHIYNHCPDCILDFTKNKRLNDLLNNNSISPVNVYELLYQNEIINHI
jgi:hypothetical protein